jgi:hypothetical protein
MKEYKNFPPLKYFLRVLKSCPKSALLYMQIWKKKDNDMSYSIIKKDIRKEHLISPTMFRNLLSPLMVLNLVTFIEKEEYFQMDILGANANE